MKDAILEEIILGYRRLIQNRYSYDNIRKSPGFPEVFSEEQVALFQEYFLNIYPLPEKREELNDAFESLNNYIKHPEKLLRILLDSTSLLFKYGRHLPKILAAGMKAMRSFQSANDFEQKLVEKAIQLDIQPPFSQEHIENLIKALSKEEIEEFIGNNIRLFETLNDKILVSKIEEIVSQLIKKMKSRPKVYKKDEIRGLEIGQEIIVKGNRLFETLSNKDQQQVFDFILKIERNVLERIFS